MLRTIPRPFRRPALAGAAAACIAAALIAAVPGPASGLAPSHSVRLKPGVTLTRYDLSGPVKVLVITDTLDASGPATIDVGAATNTIHGAVATSTIAQAHGAFAAVNGDFGAFMKRPTHAFLQDGELWQSGIQSNLGFAITAQNPYAANTPTTFLGKPQVRVQVLSPTATIGVDDWNSGQPSTGDQVMGFTSRGGTIEVPRNSDCKVHLTRVGTGSDWATAKDGVRVPYTVDTAMICGHSMSAGSKGVVLSALTSGTGRTELAGLAHGDNVTLKWSMGWPGVLDEVGGRPMLVVDGASAGTGPNGTFVCRPSNPICDREPRTAVAVNQACTLGQAGCTVMLIVVDGRQSSWSVGFTLDDFAAFLIDDLGAYTALNLDGGGSTTMWIKKQPATGTSKWWCQTLLSSGCLADRPYSVLGQRPAPTALMLLPGADPNDPSPAGP
jgi:hypothetical protein